MFPIFRKHSAPNAALLFTSGSIEGEAIGEYHGEPLYHGSLDVNDGVPRNSAQTFQLVGTRLKSNPDKSC